MSDTVAKRSKASAAMLDSVAAPRALMGGTRAMRAAGNTFLPKFEAESQEAYEARKAGSWLFNGFRKTVRDMTGRVFDKPVEIADGAPSQVLEWALNIDLAGNDLSTFARQVFEDGLSGPGVSYIMVDAPARDETVTRAQAERQNLRPYLVHLKVEDVLGWRTAVIDNVTTLVQLRIMETVNEPDPKDEFAEVEIDQVRVLDRLDTGVQVRLFRKDRADKWQQIDEPTFTGLSEITVIPFYANRSGFFTGQPMLDDLADINVAHWQSQSDQRTILHYARVPILHSAGRSSEDGPLVVNVATAVASSDPAARLEWVEHSGGAIGAGRQDLKDLEFQMETFGLQLLVARDGAQSATGEALDAKKETSTLSMTADQLQDSIEQALMWMAEYGGLGDPAISVSVNKDFGVSMITAQELAVMLQAVNSGQLSRETFLREMVRRGAIRSDLDVDAEADRIATTGPDLTGERMNLGT